MPWTATADQENEEGACATRNSRALAEQLMSHVALVHNCLALSGARFPQAAKKFSLPP